MFDEADLFFACCLLTAAKSRRNTLGHAFSAYGNMRKDRSIECREKHETTLSLIRRSTAGQAGDAREERHRPFGVTSRQETGSTEDLTTSTRPFDGVPTVRH